MSLTWGTLYQFRQFQDMFSPLPGQRSSLWASSARGAEVFAVVGALEAFHRPSDPQSQKFNCQIQAGFAVTAFPCGQYGKRADLRKGQRRFGE